MARLGELLEEALGPVVPMFSVEDVERVAVRRRRARRGVGVAVACVVAVAIVVVWTGHSDDTKVTTAVTDRGVFPDHAGDVLVFDDGYDGLTAVDLDHRLAVRRPDGGRAGDQQYRLTRVGDSLVVGWGEIYAAPLDGGAPRLVGNATIYIPAVEPGRVWLVDYPGGRVGQGTPTVRQVDLSGHTFVNTQGLDPKLGPPIIGIPGGLAYQGPTGLLLWDARTGSTTGQLGNSPVFPLDVHDRTLAWCDGQCTDLHLTTIGTKRDLTVHVPKGLAAFAGYQGRFSPDGRWLAVVAANTTGPLNAATRMRIVIIDTHRAAVHSMTPDLRTEGLGAAWSTDGHRLYLASDSYQQSTTRIGEYILASRVTRWATVSLGGALTFVAVPRDQAIGLLNAKLGKPSACPAPKTQPSGRTTSCAFRFSVRPGT